MTKFRGSKEAFGKPGIEPKWTRGNKEGVGTAYSGDSRLWFTLWEGCVTEVYYPTIDIPQIRDLQYLVTDGKSFFHEEKRHLLSQTERLTAHALGYRVTNSDPEERYKIIKEIIVSPHLPCLLQHTKIEGDSNFIANLRLYALCAPHLQNGGKNNNAYVVEVAGREILVAEKQGTWLAMAATVPFSRLSCGYVGQSDGWTDLADNFQMDWEFDRALDGNVALTGEIMPNQGGEFTLALAFGEGFQNAISVLLQALGISFHEQSKKYIDQWNRAAHHLFSLEKISYDLGNLFCGSFCLLLAHEDKTFPGALIASLSIPWGETKGDENLGGYHLVWTRDLVQSAMGLLAAGDTKTPLRALIYLTASQQDDGGFPQNFWVNGKAYAQSIQLDEVALPILLAFRLDREKALEQFDPYVMVKKAAYYLTKQGPVTHQDRWEEMSGYSPSTLASNIAALICAAFFARSRGEVNEAEYFEDYADFLECHLEKWTVTTEGTLYPSIKRHFIRINAAQVDQIRPQEDPNLGMLMLPNRLPDAQNEFPVKEIVDAGFLELVRYGIRKPDDPLIIDSLKVVDAVLKVETPFGPCWRRYNHDGYGQKEDGSAFFNGGKGRAWPLLTGERGHYELAAGKDVSIFIKAMEGFAGQTGLLPEQIWDAPDLPQAHMYLGYSTGAARPLAWAHAEYIKLLRSVLDGYVFDKIEEVSERYLLGKVKRKFIAIWQPTYQIQSVEKGHIFRIQTQKPFILRWTSDEWKSIQDISSCKKIFDIQFVDILIPHTAQSSLGFTFLWTETNKWEGINYEVKIES